MNRRQMLAGLINRMITPVNNDPWMSNNLGFLVDLAEVIFHKESMFFYGRLPKRGTGLYVRFNVADDEKNTSYYTFLKAVNYLLDHLRGTDAIYVFSAVADYDAKRHSYSFRLIAEEAE